MATVTSIEIILGVTRVAIASTMVRQSLVRATLLRDDQVKSDASTDTTVTLEKSAVAIKNASDLSVHIDG